MTFVTALVADHLRLWFFSRARHFGDPEITRAAYLVTALLFTVLDFAYMHSKGFTLGRALASFTMELATYFVVLPPWYGARAAAIANVACAVSLACTYFNAEFSVWIWQLLALAALVTNGKPK